MSRTVTIYGGGVAGAQVAHALAAKADVTLVSPLDYFEVPMALPRNLVEPGFADRSVVPFSELGGGFRHLHGTLTSFDETGAVVERSDGTQENLTSDVSILATGSHYPNAITRALSGTAKERRAELAGFNARLKAAQNVLIVGAGAIGLEFAGEISEDYPEKSVTVLEAGADILPGTSRKLAETARKRLAARKVSILTGARVASPAFGTMPEGGTARLEDGRELPFDVIFWATGGAPNTSYFPADRLSATGRIPVWDTLMVKGMKRVLVLGDIADLDEVKKAIYIRGHVPVVVKNTLALLDGKTPSATYKPQTSNDIMFLTLGRSGGVAHLPGVGTVKANWLIRMGKSKDMLVGMFRKHIGAPKA